MRQFFYLSNKLCGAKSMASPSTNTMIKQSIVILTAALLTGYQGMAGFEAGDLLRLTVRGIDPAEQSKINGEYRVGETGAVRLPFLADTVAAKGLTSEQFARAAEAAYRNSGIYTRPAIEVENVWNRDVDRAALISVGGQVRRAGETQFRKGMTMIQAIDAAGGRNDFGGRNIMLLRTGRQFVLDFSNLAHKNIVLQPGDSLQVDQVGVIDRWKGSPERVNELLPK
jgi:protein involved in polysaccharide export with SLBB domain